MNQILDHVICSRSDRISCSGYTIARYIMAGRDIGWYFDGAPHDAISAISSIRNDIRRLSDESPQRCHIIADRFCDLAELCSDNNKTYPISGSFFGDSPAAAGTT